MPSLNLRVHTSCTAAPVIEGRYRRRCNRDRRKMEASQSKVHIVVQSADDPSEIMDASKGTQTDLDGPLLSSIQRELQELTNEVASLKSEIQQSTKFDKSEFESNDDKVKYFTGLPSYSILLALFTYLEPYIPTKPLLNKFRLLILTLIHLRLNLPFQLLSY